MFLFSPNVDRMRRRKDIAGLVKCLDHGRGDVRYRALLALSRQKNLDNAVVTKMKGMLHDTYLPVRTLTTLIFTELGAHLDRENLIEVMDRGTRAEKLVLLKIIMDRGPDVNDAIVETIVMAMADSRAIVRLQAIMTAGFTGREHLVPAIAEFLDARHKGVRLEAVEALARIGSDEAVDLIIGLLVDRDMDVRGSARAALETIHSSLARRALEDSAFREILTAMAGREPQRREMVRRIGDERIRDGLPLVHNASRDRFKEVRLESARTMARFADVSSVDSLAKMLDDRFYDVRLEAVRALGNIRSDRAAKALEKALKDRNKSVRVEAEALVKYLGSSSG